MKRLICLHGFTGAPESWDAVLERLPAAVEAICPPIVGHHPDIPLTGGSFEDEVDRLAGTLPRSGGPYHLAGYSLGGRLALGPLVRHTELFSSATLVGVHPGLGRHSERSERAATDEALARRLEQGGVESFVDHWQRLPLFDSQHALPPEILAQQRRQRLGHRSAGLAHALRALSLGRMPDYRNALARLGLPIHLMVGERDDKFCRLAETMAPSLRAEVEIVPAAGHNLVLEAPDAVAAAIQRGVAAG